MRKMDWYFDSVSPYSYRCHNGRRMAEPIQEPAAGEGVAFACPHCGATDVRRSSPHGLAEQRLLPP